ncbi:hypothetical protein CHUAL_007766 [Chamberlinius hualienensis]
MNFILIFIIFLMSIGSGLGVQLQEIQNKCKDECEQSLLTQKDEIFDVHCNDTCRNIQCEIGCRQWQEAKIKNNCKNICSKQNDTKVIPIENFYCVMGCQLASSIYFQTVKDEVGVASGPVLVANSQTNVSVVVRWETASSSIIPFPVSYLLQWKYENNNGGWEYYNRSPTTTNTQLITELIPYTKYKFRVAWLILPPHDPIYSAQSLTITTLPYGVPSSSPSFQSVVPVDSSRVFVSWDSPSYPNGPIVAYILNLTQLSNGNAIIKEIPEPSDGSFMFTNLKPTTSYRVEIWCRNGIGEGPKDVKYFTTPTLPKSANQSHWEPYLILGAKQKIYQQSLEIFDLSREPKILYKPLNDETIIQGVAIHVEKRLVFVSDSSGRLLKINMNNNNSVEDLWQNKSKPKSLNVDWLNNWLYIAQDNSVISRTNLNGKNYQLVVVGLERQADDVKVDPCNGYMYWVVQGSSSGGLYQVDIGKVLNGIPVHSRDAKLIIADRKLSSFAIDYYNFRLFFPNELNNTMCSATLNGEDIVDIRNNTQQPKFQGITSLTYHKDAFYWTNGEEVLAEEYLKEKNRYYHNSFVDLSAEKPFVGLNLFHPDFQPTPKPVNPVRSLQVVFLDTIARLTWTPPKLLTGQGQGAYSQWNYHIEFINGNGNVRTTQVSDGISYTVDNLVPGTNYGFRVRPVSSSGVGPWSTQFYGQTLNISNSSFAVWSTASGLIKSDLIGDNVEILLDQSTLSDHNNMVITDIAQHDFKLFLNTKNGEIFTLDIQDTPGSLKKLPNIFNSNSLSVDWLAKKLYWSSPKHQTISRSNFDGTQVEHPIIMTIAKDLNIDSMNGYIYWTTSHTVECSRLNGGDKKMYFQTGIFSGNTVIGLTLDSSNHLIYWIVWGFNGAELHKAPTASYYLFSTTNGSSLRLPDQFKPLKEENLMNGPLRYFSNRLLWIYNDTVALVSSTNGTHVAQMKISSNFKSLITMTIVQSRSRQRIKNDGELMVIPSAVDINSVKILGRWDNFNISWTPITNINYGNVFYEVRVDDKNATDGMMTSYPIYSSPSLSTIPPYTEITVAVRAFTYWASAKRIIKTMRTPMSTPSQPINPRAFVTSINPLVEVEFRWDEPLQPNGVIKGYVVTAFATDVQLPFIKEVTDRLFYVIKRFSLNRTYHIQVQAFTEVGEGPPGDVVKVTTTAVNPVPQILSINFNSIVLLDVDNGNKTVVANDIAKPYDVTYHWSNSRVYWIDRSGTVMTSFINGSNQSELFHSDDVSPTLTLRIDWLANRLYWSNNKLIYTMDLVTRFQPEVVVSRDKAIGCIAVDPMTSSLMWTELDWEGNGRVMISRLNGSGVRSFFRRRLTKPMTNDNAMRTKKRSADCNCPGTFKVSSPIVFNGKELIFIDKEDDVIRASDIDGCNCRIIFNLTRARLNKSAITVLSANLNWVYWSYSKAEVIHSVSRWSNKSENEVKYLPYKVNGGLTAIGQQLQPFPNINCLTPQLSIGHRLSLKLISASSDSLLVYVGDLETQSVGCNDDDVFISKPTTQYIINYKLISDNEEGSGSTFEDVQRPFQQIKTYNSTVLINSLTSFSNYKLSVSLSNLYVEPSLPLLAAENTFATLEGVPWKPYNVKVTVISPERVVVSWERPLVVNGPDVRYVVHTRRSQSFRHPIATVDNSSPVTIGEQEVEQQQQHHYRYVISGLEPFSNYSVTVDACGVLSNVSNSSEAFNVKTFALPNNMSVVNVTSESVLLGWTAPGVNRQLTTTQTLHFRRRSARDANTALDDSYGQVKLHSIVYKQVGTSKQTELNWQPTLPGYHHLVNVTNLLPNTRYVFRLRLQYVKDELGEGIYAYPKDGRFLVLTKGARPSPPGQPKAGFKTADNYIITWEPSKANGGQRVYYLLELKFNNSGWNLVYNDTENNWRASTLSSTLKYNFRVSAVNEFGRSDYSDETHDIQLDQLVSLEENLNLSIVLAVTVPVIATILLCALFFIYKAYLRNEKRKTKLLVGNPDFELATLREMPLQRQNFVHQNNALYAFSDALSDSELNGVHRISKDQIELLKLLGSGAFGDVFKGLAKNLSELQVLPVAIKTLKKGATDQEKAEFLKEAQLMSNFKHDHILRLVGVCLDNDPNFLILELMEGGDLLSYLRANRPTHFQNSPLNIQDLVSICVDVAKGCCYLEELHFVHRDLAARNCLVSSHNPLERVVKIGDFGLARDVYKNDYYRKEGEGLLPVRWMSPESLVDGVFTSQSDVWAFGVLLWEVMTLGQQPYPARTNVEVLQYVRAGGRLDKPDNCPDDLHELMMYCWNYDKNLRPSFKYCLNQLEDLKHKSADLPTAVHNQSYIEARDANTSKSFNRLLLMFCFN